MARKAFDNLTPDELFEKIKDSVIKLYDLRWDRGISHELDHDDFFNVVCQETEALKLNIDEDTLYDTATKAKNIINLYLRKKSHDLANPADKRCKGEYLSAVIDHLTGSDEDIAIALGYYSTNKKGGKVALVEEFLKAKSECEPDEEDSFDGPSYDVYKQRLVVDDDHFGTVYVPKRLVEENKEFYEGTELVDFDVNWLMEKDFIDEEDAKKNIEEFGFKEPMMVQTVQNMVYINSWDLEWAEDQSWFTNEEIADYWDLRYEDCHDSSSWSDG